MMFHIDHELKIVVVSSYASAKVLMSARQSATNHGYELVITIINEEASA